MMNEPTRKGRSKAAPQLDFDLNLLPTLAILLKERSVSRTAIQLGLTQAAISAQLMRLRRHFDDPILIPSGREMHPSPFALSLEKRLEETLSNARSLISSRENLDPPHAVRRFNVHAGHIDIITLLPVVSRYLHKHAPGVNMTISTSRRASPHSSPGQTEALHAHRADFILAPMGLHNPDLPHTHLYQDRYVCIADKCNKQVKDGITEQDYFAMTHVIRHFSGDSQPSLEARYFQNRGKVRKIAQIIDNYAVLPQFLLGTPFISTVANRFAQLLAKEYPLRIIELPFKLPPIVVLLQWAKHLEHEHLAMWFRQLLIDTAADYYAPDPAGTTA